MSKINFKAVIFDLDGVITKTALVHAAAWKKMFDDYLLSREERFNEKFIAFTHTNDYLPFVDGKPRYKGVTDFLTSRNISLPYGDPSDAPETETVCGLGNKKNDAFNEVLDKEGVEVYQSTVDFMRFLKENGIGVGVASSSKNCRKVLEKAGLMPLVDTVVDGTDSVRLNLKGKPEADIFTTAADNLGVAYHESIVFEDAVSGVQAGKAGNFGLVLGLAREDNIQELKAAGADIVVEDFDDLKIEGLLDWFNNGLEKEAWSIAYHDYDISKEKSRESLLTVGNGYFGTRGAMEEIDADEKHYPGTYIAGLYNRLKSPVGDRLIENEDFVNTPNWTSIRFKIDNGDWWAYKTAKFSQYTKKLCLKTGVFSKEFIVDLADGKKIKIASARFASMDNPHLAVLKYTVTPLNFSGKITFQSGIDGAIENRGVNRYNSLNQKHLQPVSQSAKDNFVQVITQTVQSKIEIAVSQKLSLAINGESTSTNSTPILKDGQAFAEFSVLVKENECVSHEKITSIYTSKDLGIVNCITSSENDLTQSESFDQMFTAHKKAWDKLWDTYDIQIDGDRLSQKLIRLHTYHMLASASPHNVNIDASVTARGLHGEAYRGHIFWDELFILPFYTLRSPEISKSLLMYRYRRLAEAKKYAKEYGYKGAMFPWQSGSDGREETQIVHLNPLTGEWGDDYSSLQRHVSLAIAYDIWEYYNSTNDTSFMEEAGTEMFLEICRFWVSKAKKDERTGRYSIDQVMGPDEFHEHAKNSPNGGLKDNAYTNIMVSWILEKSKSILSGISCSIEEDILIKLGIKHEELLLWETISKKLNLLISEDGIIAQFDGYFELKELDWDAYREKYKNIYRMDRILKAEGKSADDYKLAKQADTLMTFYNLPEDEVNTILKRLNYELPSDYLSKNLHYYLNRTSHGSSLSRVVHGQLAQLIHDEALSWELYKEALGSDFVDIQGGTTGEGVHTGVMASTVMLAISTYAGVNLHGEMLEIDPRLPKHWTKIAFKITFKGVHYQFTITPDSIDIQTDKKVKVKIKGKERVVEV
ncbi:MAG: beta-phosphoglucomutase family hydrolase [Bacteroidales bacterium]|nr:beta-phosphoglucomutase family hydrolase [Bacteroidales bacterium]